MSADFFVVVIIIITIINQSHTYKSIPSGNVVSDQGLRAPMKAQQKTVDYRHLSLPIWRCSSDRGWELQLKGL